MSRSFKKTPVCGITCARSEAWCKKNWHSRFRHSAKEKLKYCSDYDGFIDVDFREVSNPWAMAKDGRQFIDLVKRPYLAKFLRK